MQTGAAQQEHLQDLPKVKGDHAPCANLAWTHRGFGCILTPSQPWHSLSRLNACAKDPVHASALQPFMLSQHDACTQLRMQGHDTSVEGLTAFSHFCVLQAACT